jgi:hypothetical protein
MAVFAFGVLFLLVGAPAHADSFVEASMGQAYYPNLLDEDTAAIHSPLRQQKRENPSEKSRGLAECGQQGNGPLVKGNEGFAS